MDWPIHEVAKLAGTTTRTLRHYDGIGLLRPSRVGHNGYRYYDRAALVRLQRILLLRGLGMGLPAIADIVDRQSDAAGALSEHLAWLRRDRERLDRQIESVRRTIEAVKGDGGIMVDEMFDGFDHRQYKDEVEQRWGKDSYARSDAWWSGMGAGERQDWKQASEQLGRDWIAAAQRGLGPASAEARDLARRHVEWLRGIPGTPAADGGDLKGYVLGLGEMYVADPRFAANYGGQQGAEFVRDALRAYAEEEL